jgi:hypothetical protein
MFSTLAIHPSWKLRLADDWPDPVLVEPGDEEPHAVAAKPAASAVDVTDRNCLRE